MHAELPYFCGYVHDAYYFSFLYTLWLLTCVSEVLRCYQRCYDASRHTACWASYTLHLHTYHSLLIYRYKTLCQLPKYALTQTCIVSINSNWSTGFIPVPKHGGAKPWYLSKKYVMSFHAMVCAHLPTYEEASSIKWQHISQCHATTDAWAYEFPMKGLHSPDI